MSNVSREDIPEEGGKMGKGSVAKNSRASCGGGLLSDVALKLLKPAWYQMTLQQPGALKSSYKTMA